MYYDQEYGTIFHNQLDAGYSLFFYFIELVSKSQIRLKRRVPIRFKSGGYPQCLSILSQIATQLLGLGGVFETNSNYSLVVE